MDIVDALYLYASVFLFFFLLFPRLSINYSICYTNHAFLAKESLIKLIVIYVQYLHSQNTRESAMLNIWVVTKTSLHISSLIPFLDSPAPINSFLLQQENGCLRHLIVSARQHFLLSKLPSILLDTLAQCDNDFRTAQCGRRDPSVKISPCRSHTSTTLERSF